MSTKVKKGFGGKEVMGRFCDKRLEKGEDLSE